MNPTFSEIDFYDYKIRMCESGGTKMYLVSDLLRQYNEKNGTNKRFPDYLQNKQTQELLQKRYEKCEVENSPPHKIGAISVSRNSEVLSKEGQNEQNSERENSHAHYESPLNDEKWYIPNVIQYITFSHNIGDANQGYIVCEELLHACLMWADPDFAWDVYSFLTRLRERDNDYLKRQIDELTQRCKDLKNRYVPDDDHWTYYLTYKIENRTVYLYSQFCRMERWDIAYKEIEKDGRHELYRLNRLPNGCIFRSMAEKPLREICEKYDGKAESVCHFSLPLKNWVDKDKRILASIRLQLKQVRIDLGWRTDLNNLNNE